MRVDTEVNYELVARFDLRMRRTGRPQGAGAMSGIRITALALLVAGALLTVDDASAQARRPPPPWKDPAGPPVEMGAWLKRLVGRFSFEGMVHVPAMGECGTPLPGRPESCQPVKGMADCIGIGNGPGVHCVFNVSWLDLYDLDFESGTAPGPLPGAVSYLNPAMALFGLDPGNGAINHLLVDNKGLPEGGLGANTGNRATFRTSCVNQPGILGGCERIFRIEARANSRLLYMWIDVEMGPKGLSEPASSITLSLRRLAQDESGQAPARRR